MKIFISWSGARSKYIAEALRNWLPKVIQAIDPWMSQEDISSGMRWSVEISQELEISEVGIICITPENQNKPWLMFEAGALSKSIKQTFVCPYLYDMSSSEIVGPLSQFQSSDVTKDGTRKVLHTLNNALNKSSLSKEELDEIFDVWWPKLEEKFINTPAYSGKSVIPRSSEELTKEILENTREQLRREELRLERSDKMGGKMDYFIDFLENFKNIVPVPASLVSQHMGKFSTDAAEKLEDPKMIMENMLSHLKGMQKIDENIVDKVLNPPVTKK